MAYRDVSPHNSRRNRATCQQPSGLAGSEPRMKSPPPDPREPLHLLSVVIPARNEEGCIAATVEHLHLELRLQRIPHEIVVVDDGSTDSTWSLLQEIHTRIPECKPIQNLGAPRLRRPPSHAFFPPTRGAPAVVLGG